MIFAFQTCLQLLQAIAVPSGSRVWRDPDQFADGVKRAAMPDLQDDHLPLVCGEILQASHRRPFRRALIIPPLKPLRRLKFPRQPPPQASPVIQDAIPKRADGIMLRVLRLGRPLHQPEKGLVQDILGLAVAEPKSPTVKQQLGGFRLIQPVAPPEIWSLDVQLHSIDTAMPGIVFVPRKKLRKATTQGSE